MVVHSVGQQCFLGSQNISPELSHGDQVLQISQVNQIIHFQVSDVI